MKRTVINAFIFILISSGMAWAAVPQYEMDCIFYPANHTLKIKQSVVFANNQDLPINEVYFHIYPNRKFSKSDKDFLLRFAGYFKINPFPEGFQSANFNIQRIYSLDKDLRYEITGDDKTILKVILPFGLVPGAKIQINLDFDLGLPHAYGRLGWHKNIISLGRWYPILSVLDQRGWHNYPYYLYHRPYFSEASLYKLKITLPVDLKIASTGIQTSQTENSDKTKTISIDTEVPVRDFAMVLSKDF